MRITKALLALAIFSALPALAQAQDQPKVGATPALPQYGQAVNLQLQNVSLQYLPALRYSIAGSIINVDYEYIVNDFGSRPDFGISTISLGELAPGNYEVRARLYDIAQSTATPASTLSSSLAVVPPGNWGLYMVPAQPHAFAATQVVVKSAAYFYQSSMRASVSGNVIRVDFDYVTTSPAMMSAAPSAPANTAMYGTVSVPTVLAPGAYAVEGWGRTNGGDYEKFFTSAITIAASTPVVEYYSAALDHYFMAMGADEIALLDRGIQGDWKRTGGQFNAWVRRADAAAGAAPVCRFYARGPNSHFFTGNNDECNFLKALEQKGRADAAANGQPFLGWGYEGIAFYALMPANGQCMQGSTPVRRYYNDRAAEDDSNHRFTIDPTQQYAMSATSIDEGVAFCSAP